MPLIPSALTTVAQVKAHAGIDPADTSKDSVIEFLVNGCSAWLSKRCRRSFLKTSYVVKLDGDGTRTLMLPQYPVVQLTSVKVDGATVPATDYQVYVDSGIIDRASGWPQGSQNIEVTYQAGWTMPQAQGRDLPYDLEMCAVRLVARVLEKRTAEGASRASSGGLSVDWSKALDDETATTISLYTKPRA